MRMWMRLGLGSLFIFLFQNCGSFRANDQRAIYPYQVQPDFFYDLKLVRVEVDDRGREVFEFDVAVSFATNSEQSVNYRMAFSTLDRPGICRSEDRTATGVDKHQRFLCILPTPDDLYVQLTLLGPTGEQEVRQYRF